EGDTVLGTFGKKGLRLFLVFRGVELQLVLWKGLIIGRAVQDAFGDVVPVHIVIDDVEVPATGGGHLGRFPVVEEVFLYGILVSFGLMDVDEQKYCGV